MRTPRRRSREFALQAIYQFLLNPEYSLQDLINNIKETETYVNACQEKKTRVDESFFEKLVAGIYYSHKKYELELIPYVDRELAEINHIELAILLIACHELMAIPETPFPVIINEAVELAKIYAKEDSYKFINGVLDRLAILLRPNENSL